MKRQPKRTLDREPTAAECKAFNARKMALLDKAVLDADLTDFQHRLLTYIVSKYLWRPGNLAYPGYDVLVEGFGASRSAIREALDQLEARNYLTCIMRGQRGRGQNRANTYELGPGPQSYQRRVYKSKKSNAYENQSAAVATVCERNQSAATATVCGSTECRHGVNQSAAQTAPNSLEGTPLHTQSKGVCGEGKDKKEEPASDSSDMTDAEIMEMFKAMLAEKEGISSPDSSQPNGGGHGLNGHGPTSPTTDAAGAWAITRFSGSA